MFEDRRVRVVLDDELTLAGWFLVATWHDGPTQPMIDLDDGPLAIIFDARTDAVPRAIESLRDAESRGGALAASAATMRNELETIWRRRPPSGPGSHPPARAG
jgi:hypothetical protein